MLALAALGLWMSAWALVVPFTAMDDAARAIDRLGLQNARWAAYPGFIGVELSSRLDAPYYDVQQQCLSWFQKWNAASVEEPDPATIAARLKTAAAAVGGRIMLLSIERLDAPGLTLVEAFDQRLLRERALIYEITAPPDSTAAALRACS
jgi:hypothetical protein